MPNNDPFVRNSHYDICTKKDCFKGYVILSEGDTLFRKKYIPDEILGYGADAYIYESVPLREDPAFFRFDYYIEEGNERVILKVVSRVKDLTCYHWEYIDDDSHNLDYIRLFYRNGSNEMVRVTQGILGLKRNKLTRYFFDCPDP
jgi:hypothetical protein